MTADSPKQKYYAVSKGKKPGIYDNWHDADKQVSGFSRSCFKGFSSERLAEGFMQAANIANPKRYFRNQSDSCRDIAYDNQADLSLSSSIDLDELDSTVAATDAASAASTPTTTRSTTTTKTPMECGNCQQLKTLIDQLTRRISAMEKHQVFPLVERIDKMEALISTQSTNSTASGFKLAELSSKIDSLNKTITNLNSNQSAPPYQSIPRSTPTNSSHHDTVQTQGQAPNTTQTRPLSHQPSRPSSQSNRHQVPFHPVNCIVVSSSQTDKDRFKHTDQDEIRKTIGENHGPLIIDFINRYHFNSASPKFIVQFSSPENATRVVDEWKPDSLGGSVARKTINPKDNPTHIGMVKGVPRDIADDELLSAIHIQYPDSTFIRLFKDQQPLRTLKLTFTTETQLKQAFTDGLLVSSSNMMFRVEPPYTTLRSASRQNVD